MFCDYFRDTISNLYDNKSEYPFILDQLVIVFCELWIKEKIEFHEITFNAKEIVKLNEL